MKHKVSIFLPLLLLLASCVKEDVAQEVDGGEVRPAPEVVFSAGFSDETKTALIDGKSLMWETNESISILCGKDSARFVSTNTGLSRQTEFIGRISRAKPLVYATYPYSSTAHIDADSVLVFDLPSAQISGENSFSTGQFPCVARTEGNDLHFKNVCGGARITFARSDIESIEFSSNDPNVMLSGATSVTFDDSGSPVFQSISGGSNTITLKPSSGTFNPDTTYYLVLPPVILKSGYTIHFNTPTSYAQYVTSQPVRVSRSSFAKLEKKDDGLIFTSKEDIVISAIITDGETVYREADGDKIYMIDNEGFNDMVAVVDRVNVDKDFSAFSGGCGWAGGWIYMVDWKWNFYHNTGAGYHRFSSVSGTSGIFTLSVESGTPKVNGQTTYNIFSSWSSGDGTLAIFGWYNTDDKEHPYWECLGDAGNKVYSFTIDGIEFTPVLHWNSIEHKYFPTWRYTYNDETHYMRLIQGNPTYETVEEPYVDLGLSVKWAKCNVGATKPEEYGRYFAWGDVSGQTWDGSSWSGGGFSSDPSYELDANGNLKPEYDAAYVNLGGTWRMPTKTEQEELMNNCTSVWTSDYNGTGVAGRIFTSNKEGYTDKSIFLPAAGIGNYSIIESDGGIGRYWSGTYGFRGAAWLLLHASDNIYTATGYSYLGQSVRPVSE